MCTNPIKIRNPHKFAPVFQYDRGDVMPLEERFLSKRDLIEVPCGKCPDCRDSYFTGLRQRSQCETMTSYAYLVTLTYDDAHIPSLTFTAAIPSPVTYSRRRPRIKPKMQPTLQTLYYADISHIQSMIKRLRNATLFQQRSFRYLAVTEYGSERFRPHHHLIVYVSKLDADDQYTAEIIRKYLWIAIKNFYAVNIGTRENPIYEPLFTYKISPDRKSRNYDVTLIVDKKTREFTPDAVSRATSYVLTYVNKPSQYDAQLEPLLQSLNEQCVDSKLVSKLSQIIKCRVYYSKHFGFGFDTTIGHPVRPTLRCCTFGSKAVLNASTLAQLPSDISYLDKDRLHRLMWFRRHMLSLVQQFDTDSSRLYDNSMFYAALKELFQYRYDFRPNSDRFAALDITNYFTSFQDLCFHLLPEAREALLLCSRYDVAFLRRWLKLAHFASESYYPSLLPVRDFDPSFESSVTYKYIRRSVENGLAGKSPFLSFELSTATGYIFSPLCRYFRRYCTDFEDVRKLYDTLGYRDKDDFLDKMKSVSIFTTQLRMRIQQTNQDDHEMKRDRDDSIYLSALKSKVASLHYPTTRTIDSFFPNDDKSYVLKPGKSDRSRLFAMRKRLTSLKFPSSSAISSLFCCKK